MKVKDLIHKLKELPGDYIVVLSSDGEGNDFNPVYTVSSEMYVPDSTWSGKLRYLEFSEEYDEPHVDNAVVIWPTN
jgi:hypothetical protein